MKFNVCARWVLDSYFCIWGIPWDMEEDELSDSLEQLWSQSPDEEEYHEELLQLIQCDGANCSGCKELRTHGLLIEGPVQIFLVQACERKHEQSLNEEREVRVDNLIGRVDIALTLGQLIDEHDHYLMPKCRVK